MWLHGARHEGDGGGGARVSRAHAPPRCAFASAFVRERPRARAPRGSCEHATSTRAARGAPDGELHVNLRVDGLLQRLAVVFLARQRDVVALGAAHHVQRPLHLLERLKHELRGLLGSVVVHLGGGRLGARRAAARRRGGSCVRAAHAAVAVAVGRGGKQAAAEQPAHWQWCPESRPHAHRGVAGGRREAARRGREHARHAQRGRHGARTRRGVERTTSVACSKHVASRSPTSRRRVRPIRGGQQSKRTAAVRR